MSETKYTDITGTDLYKVFLPTAYSSDRANTTNFRIGGNDLNTIFAGRTDKTIDHDTGFRVKNYNGDGNDIDLRYIFAPLPLYYPNGVCSSFTNENGKSGIIFYAYKYTQALTFFYDIPVNFVLVAGGGNGGWYVSGKYNTGGGGGGGIYTGSFTTVAFKGLNINIGFGGATSGGGSNQSYGTNYNGSGSSFDTYSCTGGTGGLNGGTAGSGNLTGGAGGGSDASGNNSGLTSITIGNTTYPFSGGGAGGYTSTSGANTTFSSGYAGYGIGGAKNFNSSTSDKTPSGQSAQNYGGGGGGTCGHVSQNAGDKNYCGASGAGGNGLLIVYWDSSYDR